MSWAPIFLTFTVFALVAANIALLVSNHKLMKASKSLLTTLSEYEELHRTLMHSRDEWRTKARVLQGKYEPIGRVVATGHVDMIAPGETIEIKLHSPDPMDPDVERWWRDKS